VLLVKRFFSKQFDNDYEAPLSSLGIDEDLYRRSISNVTCDNTNTTHLVYP
jgi:hypothetical protein